MTLPITAIIVGFHSDAVLPQCVASLTNAQEIIVMDNGGTTQLANTSYFHNRKNLGFGRAINRAFSKTKTPYALILNPDAAMKPGTLEVLYQTAQQHPEAAIIAPVLEDERGNTRIAWRLGHFQKRPMKAKQDIENVFCVGHIAAAAWLMNMKAVQKIGGFDKKIFLFFEDDDYTLRTRNAGYSIIVEPAARALHLQGKSSPPTLQSTAIKQFYYAYSGLYFTRKHRGRTAAALRLTQSLFNTIFRTLGALLRFNFTEAFGHTCRLFAAAVFLTRTRNWVSNHKSGAVFRLGRTNAF